MYLLCVLPSSSHSSASLSLTTHFSREQHLGSENPTVWKSPPLASLQVSSAPPMPETAGMCRVGKMRFTHNPVPAVSPEYELT